MASRLAGRTSLTLQRLLLPIAAAIVMGGALTMVGNSPLILLNDLLVSANNLTMVYVGLELLALHEERLGNLAAARKAQEDLVALRGTDATAADHARLAALMTEAAGGLITPEAEAQMARALQLDPRDPQARFMAGLLQIQNGRPDRAFPVWAALLAEGPADAPWLAPIRASIQDLAWFAGQPGYTPPEPSGTALPGPDAEAMAAAEAMTPEDRRRMVEGMVEGLETRLATQGGTPDEWARLIGALVVIGRQDHARDILAEARAQGAFDDATLTEVEAQEIIDALVIKLRIVRFLRTEDYDQIFSGDPYWATWSDAGFGNDGRHMVTKTSFRLLQTLVNLGPSPEPNITIFWDPKLPEGYKEFCAHISIETSSIQYESDRQIREQWGDDAAIACCVSPMEVGKQMQFFGARVNAAKALLYAINGGRDEVSGKQVVEGYEPIKGDGPLDFDEVWQKYEEMLDWVVGTYVEALNIIHYSHDKYAYEAVEMALHDSNIVRSMGCGIAGLSIVADSLAAIKYAKVTPVRDETGLITDYITEGEFPFYGNDDDRADDIAATIVHTVMEKIKAIPMYRNAIPTQSVLTITSNVVYGKATGAFPSGHKAGTPFSPGANPENGADSHGMVASMLSVGKLDYKDALDGISLTNTITPSGLGRTPEERINNLVGVLDAGFIMEK